MPDDQILNVDLVKYNEILINDTINNTSKQLDQIEGNVERRW